MRTFTQAVEELSVRRELLLLGKRRLDKVDQDYAVAHMEHEADFG